jgi:hypothetical protein
MTDLSDDRQQRWQQIVAQTQQEYRTLSSSEKRWIGDLLTKIDRLQCALDHLFIKAGGEQVCATCEGACCAKGHNHVGLPNLLAYLQQDELPPPADFAKTCPWLGPQGCVHPVGHRPYNCITFLCDKLEQHLNQSEVVEFYRLDRELRKLYQTFANHYLSGGMSGLLLQTARLNGHPLLSLRSESGKDSK